MSKQTNVVNQTRCAMCGCKLIWPLDSRYSDWSPFVVIAHHSQVVDETAEFATVIQSPLLCLSRHCFDRFLSQREQWRFESGEEHRASHEAWRENYRRAEPQRKRASEIRSRIYNEVQEPALAACRKTSALLELLATQPSGELAVEYAKARAAEKAAWAAINDLDEERLVQEALAAEGISE